MKWNRDQHSAITTDAFLANVTRVLEFGSANSTLKWALLMGLIDAAPVFMDEERIPLGLVAETVARRYQRRAAGAVSLSRMKR